MKYAILFGINYDATPENKLNGCVNDVRNMQDFLKNDLKFDKVKTFTDENNIYDTGFQNIVYSIYKLALKTYREDIELVYLHFSGHGTSIRDSNHDELDGKDEAFVPSDYKRRGIITDDLFKKIFKIFNEKTKVICVFDCCHSGTIGDLKYKWLYNKNIQIQNKDQKCKANIITISGCMDNQTSADAYNVLNLRSFTGALTSCLLMSLKQSKDYNIFDILSNTRKLLHDKQFTQYPQLCSSYEIREDESLFIKN